LQIWKTGEWKELFQLKGHTQGVYSLAFGDGGKVLLSASDCNPQNEKEAILWDLRTRKEIARFSSESAGPLVAAFCPKTGIFTTGLTQAGDSMGVFRLSDYTK
jgi:WD40 repeat protein